MYSSCYIPFLSKLHHYLPGCTRQKLGISLPTAPSASSTKIYQSLIQWIHTGCLVKNNAWRALEQIASFSMVEAGLRAVPKQCTIWPCTMGDQWYNRVPSLMDSSGGGILGGSSPSGSTPTLPTSHLSSETQLRNRHGASILTMKELIPATNRAVTTSEQSRGPAQHPVQVLVTTRPATPLIKGIMAKDMEERGVRHLY